MKEETIGGCVRFSGILAAKTFLEKNHKQYPDFLLIHGNQDNLVRYQALNFTKTELQKMGCNVQTYTVEDGQHKITDDGLNQMVSFIKEKTVKRKIAM